VALQLRRLGFQHAEALQGGLNAWRSQYPVESTSDAAA
jgi:3-mercaptopyruvate sulfurtransferase SseA